MTRRPPTYADAAGRQADLRRQRDLERLEEQYRGGAVFPQPSRITMALDVAGLWGPEVDEACLAVEPAVDEWEAGRSAPSWEQLTALAEVTGMTVPWFFVEPAAEDEAPAWVCGPRRCTYTEPRPRVEPYNPSPPAEVVPLHRETLW